jgi:hypothetical protein
MSYTEDTSVLLAPGEMQDISEDFWVKVLDRAGSFTVDALWAPFDPSERPDAARQLYRLVTAAGQRASYWLAKPFEEHSAGLNENSVLWRHKTRSWGNATSVRDPNIDGWELVHDDFRGRDYVKYANVIDSMKDALYRITDPTFVYVKEGRRSFIDVGERFVGAGPNADNYVAGLVRRANAYVAEEGSYLPMAAQIPGFAWYPADADHYQRGRSEKIRGGAQHYTAGTNSLNWLAKTSEPEVSVHFLVKHTPTLEDRGWQLVRIEDTAWTTAFANPYTVAIEYEHKQGQDITDIAYEVLAVTWAEITRYVTDRSLGAIETIAGHKTWVNNPGLTCPDGIDVGRIVTRWNALMKGGDPPSPVTDWPKVPTAARDPWRADNPWGKDKWIPKVFINDILAYPWHLTGYVLSEAFAEGDLVVQYFERARLELHRDGLVTRGLVGLEAMVARYPERAP